MSDRPPVHYPVFLNVYYITNFDSSYTSIHATQLLTVIRIHICSISDESLSIATGSIDKDHIVLPLTMQEKSS
ncbi:hypothetical protein, partial [Salmonella enterica]|uniref:hypothetical protein n=1 Tax=Salmonella enterica TaxID=28901 RepID=UPI001C99C612